MNKKVAAVFVILIGIIVIIFVATRGKNKDEEALGTPAPATKVSTSAQAGKENGGGESDTSSDTSVPVGTRVGNQAPDFEVVDYEGKTVALSDFRGKKPVFINFWATWCPFCIDELPLMARLQDEFGDSFVTLAIDRGESLKKAKNYSDDLGVTEHLTMLLNEKDDLYKKYGGFAMPYSLFLDSDGVVRDVKLGPLSERELRDKLAKIISTE